LAERASALELASGRLNPESTEAINKAAIERARGLRQALQEELEPLREISAEIQKEQNPAVRRLQLLERVQVPAIAAVKSTRAELTSSETQRLVALEGVKKRVKDTDDRIEEIQTNTKRDQISREAAQQDRRARAQFGQPGQEGLAIAASYKSQLNLALEFNKIDLERVAREDDIGKKRIMAAQAAADLEKQTANARIAAETQIDELRAKDKQQARDFSGQVFEGALSRRPADAFKNLGKEQGKIIFQNLTTDLFKGMRIPLAQDADSGIGKALKGTLWGADPGKQAQDLNSRETARNSVVTEQLTKQMASMASASQETPARSTAEGFGIGIPGLSKFGSDTNGITGGIRDILSPLKQWLGSPLKVQEPARPAALNLQPSPVFDSSVKESQEANTRETSLNTVAIRELTAKMTSAALEPKAPAAAPPLAAPAAGAPSEPASGSAAGGLGAIIGSFGALSGGITALAKATGIGVGRGQHGGSAGGGGSDGNGAGITVSPAMHFAGVSAQNTITNALSTLGLKKPSEYSPVTHTPVYKYTAPGFDEAATYKSSKILLNTASGAMKTPESRSLVMRHEETHALLEPFIEKLTSDKALEKYIPKIRQGLEEKSPIYKTIGGLPAANVISEGLAYKTGSPEVPGLGKDESRAFMVQAMKDLDKTTVQLYNKLSSSQAPALYFADKKNAGSSAIESIASGSSTGGGKTDSALEADTQALTLNTAATKDLTEALRASAENPAPSARATPGSTLGGGIVNSSSTDLASAIPALQTFGSDIKGLTGSAAGGGLGALIAGLGALSGGITAIAHTTGIGVGRGQHGGSAGGGGSDGNGAGVVVVGNDGLPLGQANSRLTDTITALGGIKKGAGIGGFLGTAERGIGSFAALMANPFGDKGGLPGVNGQPGKDLGHFSKMGIAAAGADVALGAYTAFTEFKKGGARGALGGTSAILGTAAALDPEPVSKMILGIAAMGTSLVKSILGDPRAQREKQIEKTLFTNQYLAPEALNVTSSTRGTFADLGRSGDYRISNLSPYPRVTTPYLDVPFRFNVPGTQDSQFGGGGPVTIHNHVTNHINALDGASFEGYLKKNPTALMEGIAHGATFGHSRATQALNGMLGRG
jgi:hypothetical protein